MRKRSRIGCWAAVLAFGPPVAAFGQEAKPGAIIVRPRFPTGGTPAPAADATVPVRPGYIVIRPQGRGGRATLATPAVARGDERRPGTIAIRPGGQEPPPATPPVAIPLPPPAVAPPAQADAAKENKELGTVVLETWDAISIRGQKIGHFHVVAREFERDGQKYIYATKKQDLTVARFGQRVHQWAEDATLETPDGQVLTVRMRQGIGRDQMLTISGQVNGKTLSVKGEGPAAAAQDVPWPDGVLGIHKEAMLLKDRRPKAGERLVYQLYEGRLNAVIKSYVEAKGVEEVVLADGQKPRKLLRLEMGMETIEIRPGEPFRLPPSDVWCDPETYEVVKTEFDMPTLGGRLAVVRTTKEVATRPVGKVPDIADIQPITLDRTIPRVHDQQAVVYRITMADEPNPETAFKGDDRQAVRGVDKAAKSFELHVAAVRRPGDAAADPAAKPPGDEYLSNNFFIDWDAPAVKQHAAAAVAGLPPAASAWDKARAIEGWVRRSMKGAEFDQAMATASNVARTLTGDCTEFAMLAVGLCRANGVPSRTVQGLVYATDLAGTPVLRDGKPMLAYHMWFEVYADGRWVALDGTLGFGSVGPGHVKINDASWHNEKSMVPLLPLLRVLGARPKVEVVTVTPGR